MATPCDVYYHSFKSYLGKSTIEGFRSSNAFKKDSRGKLQKLPYEQFIDLTADVYDELVRRVEESKKMPFLPPSTCFSSKRNQARQKLGTLSEKRFNDLIGDLFIDLLIRFPELDSSFRSCIKNFPERTTRPLPPSTPPSSMHSGIFDLTSIMTDVIEKKVLPSYSEHSKSLSTFPAGLESVSKKYEAELAVAYRINQDLERKLSNRVGNKSPEESYTPSLVGSPSLQIDYELLKEDFNKLRKENEKNKLKLKTSQDTINSLTQETLKLKETLSLYETEGSLSLASQFAALQRQHAEMKYEYQVEMDGLRRRYLDLESAHSRHLTLIESIGKNNEILEVKLRQVNQVLETSQEDSTKGLNKNTANPKLDHGSTFLISEFVIKQLRSSISSLLETARSNSSFEVVHVVKPLVAKGRHIIHIVDQFETEVSDLNQTFTSELTKNKDDFSSALSNILTLSKQQSLSSPHSAYNQFEFEANQLVRSAENLQLLLQSNFCSLPYFSSEGKSSKPKCSVLNKSSDNCRFNLPLSSVSKTFGSTTSLAFQAQEVSSNKLASFSTPELFRPTSDISDDLLLDPLREYLEEQTEVIILYIDKILGCIRKDNFSSLLAEKISTVHHKVQQMLVETKQYGAVPHLNESPRLQSVTKELAIANQTFFCLLEELQPFSSVKIWSRDEAGSLDPNVRTLKQRIATCSFDLARNIKALVQSVS